MADTRFHIRISSENRNSDSLSISSKQVKQVNGNSGTAIVRPSAAIESTSTAGELHVLWIKVSMVGSGESAYYML
jgi:hypothetical protein